MRFMNSRGASMRGFVAGAIFGMIVGAVGLVSADIPHKAWDKFSKQFHLGYIIGFYDAATYARNLDADGFFDRTYPVFKDATWRDFASGMEDVYAKDENKNAGSARALALTAIAMKEKFKVYGHIERFKHNFKNLYGAKGKKPVTAAPAQSSNKPAAALKPDGQHKSKNGDVAQDKPGALSEKGRDKKASGTKGSSPKNGPAKD